jgi:membrane protein YdbS with pleckstrin-like domain
MNPNQQPDDAKLQSVDNPLKVMQPGERVICEIKRHPFGLFGLYLTLALVVVLAIAAVAIAPHYISGITQQTKAAIAFGAVIVCVIVGLYTYIAATIYKGNRWIVTTDSLTQVSQVGLFRKQTSQLSMANLEDVSVEQDGMVQSMLGFGRLRAETAGDRTKFMFDFCPNPNECAKQIIAAHEAYIAEKPGETQNANQALITNTAFNQAYAAQQMQASAPAPSQPQSQQPIPSAQHYQPAPQLPVYPVATQQDPQDPTNPVQQN